MTQVRDTLADSPIKDCRIVIEAGDLRAESPLRKACERAKTAVAKLFGEEPSQQIRDDLRRFKQVMEIGEVVLSDGSLQGPGEGATKERPAQPPGVEVRR